MDNTGEKPVGDWPEISEKHWYTLALTCGIFSIIAFVAAAIWVFSDADAARRMYNARSLTPFGATLLAVVTFCTVAWRAKLTERQNEMTEERQLTELFQKGVELFSDEEPAKQSAGVASLAAVATDKKTIDENTSWSVVSGANHVRYKGGNIDLSSSDLSEGENVYYKFDSVDFEEFKINRNIYAINCIFRDCDILRMSVNMLRTNRFELCNFSDCLFEGRKGIPNLKDGRNYYFRGHEPRGMLHGVWTDVLVEIVRKKDP